MFVHHKYSLNEFSQDLGIAQAVQNTFCSVLKIHFTLNRGHTCDIKLELAHTLFKVYFEN